MQFPASPRFIIKSASAIRRSGAIELTDKKKMASEESGGQNRPPQRHISWPPPAPESHAFQEANAGQVPRGYVGLLSF